MAGPSAPTARPELDRTIAFPADGHGGARARCGNANIELSPPTGCGILASAREGPTREANAEIRMVVLPPSMGTASGASLQ
jgi:hypothetical protein